MLREILYGLPFGCLYYFHKKKDEYFDLVENLQSKGEQEQAYKFHKRYQRASNIGVVGAVTSILPSGLYFAVDGSVLSLSIFLVNLMVSHNYSEFIFGKIINKWIREYYSSNAPDSI